ncbi:MAG: efflux RND transporter permease subunit [Bacteroidetes bacterium]|nr:efflux RND transporter permease subunit [Bacteroidota bacterium]MCL2303169.1 efflux RND transporter permease subunit [Lentimicrobiaceae bacterium]
MNISAQSVKNPITTVLVYVAIAIIGVYSLSRLAIDFLPDLGSNTIMVLTSYNGASPYDIENNVTRPLENVLATVSDVKHITSSSRENYSIITLEFRYGIDIEQAVNDVRDKLDMVTAMLPDNVNRPIIYKFSAADIPIMMVSVESRESTNALYKILDDRVASPISRINGVGTVSISGAPQREINIYADPFKLESYGLTIEQITQIIRMENMNMPLGTIDIGSKTYSMRVQGEFMDAQLLNDIVVGSFNNKNVFLRDVAVVADTIQERLQEVYTNGMQGALLVIQKQAGGNSVEICNRINLLLPELQPNLPPDVKLAPIWDTSESIVNTINSLNQVIVIILVLVVLVIMLFLGRWRATFIIAITIPVSLIAAFIYLLITGNTINIISLSSLSIAIGMVIDDAIVIIENISKHIDKGSKPRAAAVFATREVSLSVIASTLVILVVFIPLTMLQGMAGILFKQMGWIISITAVISTVVALTLTPMMAAYMLKREDKHGKWYKKLYGPIERALDKLDLGYGKLLNWAVNHKIVVIVMSILIFFSSIMLIRIIPTEFLPVQDNAFIGINIKFPIGTRMETSRAFALEFEKELREEYPEIVRINFNVGQPSETNTWGRLQDNGSHIISMTVRLLKKTERRRGIEEIADQIRAKLNQYPEINTYALTAGGGMAGQNNVTVEVYGHDFNTTDRFAAELANRMRDIPGCTEVNISRAEYAPEIQVDFDRKKLAENGLNLATVSSFIQNRFSGSIASYYREDGDEYFIRVRLAPEFRQRIDAIENIIVYNAQGNGIRVQELGTVVERLTPPTIERKDRERVVKVVGIVGAGAALSQIAGATMDVLAEIDTPPGITTILAGTFQDQQESFNDIFMLLALIIILVYIVMASQFESFTYPFVIMFSIPFAFTGVFIGLAVTNTALGLMALLGIVMLVGIVVKNGIVLIDYTILCRERGMGIKEAVVAAGHSRLRPILMTAITTVLGMLPLALGRGEGAEMWNSLGMTVAWGLSFSTLITLVLIPVLYASFAQFGAWRKRRKKAAN